MRKGEPDCRLYALLARDGRSAVVFRRGPSRQVCLIRWWLSSDTVEIGQWLRGRIYERRCDLSPDGGLLVYFAARHSGPIGTWTALSRPPWFTALALWPKGDAWGGGGLFESSSSLGLNHRADQLALHTGFALPPHLRVASVADWAGHGEDHPIEHARLTRDGWRLVTKGERSEYSHSGAASWTYAEPEVYVRDQPGPQRARRPAVELRRELHAIGVRGGRWLDEAFVVTCGGAELRRFPHCDWADWHATGDLLVATGGCLWRLGADAARLRTDAPLDGARLVAELAPLRFEARQAPADASTWPRVTRPPRPPRDRRR